MATAATSQPAGLVGVRDLREDASAVIAEVEKGGWFVVSKRGKPVGVLLPSAMAQRLLMQHAAEILALQLAKHQRTD